MVLRRLSQIYDRSPVIAALFEVHCQFGCNLSGTLSVGSFTLFADQQMQASAAAGGDALIKHLLVQRVNKTVARGYDSIRLGAGAGCSKKLVTTLKLFAVLLDLHQVLF